MRFPGGKCASLASRLRSEPHASGKFVRGLAFLLLSAPLLFSSGCRLAEEIRKPTILLDQVPTARLGGPDPLGQIAGRVTNNEPGAYVILYARANAWYVQPFRSHAETHVAEDGTWSNVTHLGSEYAALLVRPGYRATPKLSTLPPVGGDVLAVATTTGLTDKPAEPKTIRFSGYDWKVRSALGERGGEVCDYEASNVWVDEKGYLHLRMGQAKGQWYCAGVSLTRSLGYGTYRFVIADSARMPLSPVLAIFTRIDQEDSTNRTGLGIQLSQWGKPNVANADYVVTPFYIPGNVAHFTVPAGAVTHQLRWEPGTAEFTTYKGASVASRDVVKSHVFKSGIPIPSTETIRMDFYDYRHIQNGMSQPVEIVVEKFDYLP